MLPLIAGGMAALSIAGNVAGNSAIRSSARSNLASQQAQLEQNFNVAVNDLQDKAQELNQMTGIQLTDLLYQTEKAEGQVEVQVAEREITGRTAYRQQKMASMKASQMEDSIIQQGEASMKGLQRELTNTKYRMDSGQLSASMDYANTMSKQKGTLSILSEAGGAALSGASMAKGLGLGSMGNTGITKSVLDAQSNAAMDSAFGYKIV